MKSIFILVFALSASAFAGECVDKNGQDIYNNPEAFQALIEKSESCYEAKALAESCAYGSSIDVSTAGLAYQVCANELAAAKPSQQLSATLKSMASLCDKKYANEQGTMYRSMNAFCRLGAVEWILGIASPVDGL
jgi:hypothetical protein